MMVYSPPPRFAVKINNFAGSGAVCHIYRHTTSAAFYLPVRNYYWK